jgi:chromosomal replication initiation ATPase DnaA
VPAVIKQYRLVAYFRPKTEISRPRIHEIISEVAKRHGVTPIAIISDRRNTKLVAARHEAMWRARNETTYSLPRIGRAFRRDHTTVLHGVAKHEKRIAANSSSGDIETDGRGNIAKRKPIRASIGAISIPDIRINSNGHNA